MKQYAFLLVNGDTDTVLAPLQDRPTGSFVEVLDNDGETISVEIMTGGWSQIGSIGEWNAVLSVSTDAGYTALLPSFFDDVIELARMTNIDDNKWPELNDEPNVDAVSATNAWLIEQGFDVVDPSTNLEFANSVLGLFLEGFSALDSVSIN